MPVDKINGVSVSAISKINGIAIANIRYWNDKIISYIPVPTGLILPYNSDGADPSGWTTWTDADGCHIIGAGDTYAVNDTAVSEGSKTVTVPASGGHTQAGYNNYAHGADGCGGTAEPAHDHDMSFTYVPPYQKSRLIKADAGEIAIPQNAAVWTWDTTPATLDNIWTGESMYMSNTTLGTGGTNSITGRSSDTQPNHDHGGIRGAQVHGYPADRKIGKASGGHTHTGITVTMTNTLRRYALAAWEHASNSFDVASNLIGMYESLTPPANWVLCDGDNGTPDLRNYFIKNVADADKGVATGNGTVTATANLTHSNHNHDNGTIGTGAISAAYHAANKKMEAHELSENYTWLPAYYALAFIMKV